MHAQTQEKTLNLRSVLRLSMYFLLFLSVLFFRVTPSYAAQNQSSTPVQILEVSKSSFQLLQGQHEQMILSLINITDSDQHVLIENDGSDFVSLEYDEDLVIPAESIVRVPITIEVGRDVDSKLIQDSLSIQSVDIPSSLQMNVVQPIQVNVLDVGRIVKSNPPQAGIHILVLYLLITIVLLGAVYSKRRHMFPVFALTFSLGFGGLLMVMKSPVSYDVNLQTSSIKLNKEVMEQSNRKVKSSFFQKYTYKEHFEKSYIELYGEALDEHTIVLSSYEQPIGLTADTLDNDGNGSPDVDIEGASEDVDTQGVTNDVDVESNVIDSNTENTDSATSDIDALSDQGATENTDAGVWIRKVESKRSKRVLYKTNFGDEAPFVRALHPVYKGIEVRVLAFFDPRDIDRQYIRKYVKRVLAMNDDGRARMYARQLCNILEPETLDLLAKPEFREIVLNLLEDENVEEEILDTYIDLIFNTSDDTMHLNAQSLCTEFSEAHRGILRNFLKEADPKNFSNKGATPNAAKAGSIPKKKKELKQKEKPERDKEKKRKFKVYDAPDTSDEDDSTTPSEEAVEEVVEDNSSPEETQEPTESTVIELDLTQANLVEVAIPQRIILPPLSRETQEYTAKNNMGDFEIETLQEASDWNGFFTFETIRLNDGKELDNMWIEIENQSIQPEKTANEFASYLHYQISDELFPPDITQRYHFNPNLWLKVPPKAMPGTYNSDISFTLIQ